MRDALRWWVPGTAAIGILVAVAATQADVPPVIILLAALSSAVAAGLILWNRRVERGG